MLLQRGGLVLYKFSGVRFFKCFAYQLINAMSYFFLVGTEHFVTICLILKFYVFQTRILNIISDAKSNVTMKDVLKKHNIQCSKSQSLKAYVDKTITLGKLEGAVRVYLLSSVSHAY